MAENSNDLPPELGNVHSIKFGSGVLGKTAPVICLAELMIGAAAWKMGEGSPELTAMLVILGIVLAVIYVLVGIWYGIKHPGPALLEGAHLLQYRELSMRTNDPLIIDAATAQAPNMAPPHILRGGGRHD